MLPLNDQELLRYNRQITLQGFDIDKQTTLKNSSVLIIGMGGLGCSAALYLSNAGIGQLTIVDFDTVTASNLNRQILFTERSLGQKKVHAAKQTLLQYNSTMNINSIEHLLNDERLLETMCNHHIVLDCSDNLNTRQQINRCCFQLRKPLISGSAIRMEGLVSVFTYQKNQPCYHCLSQLFNDEQLSCVDSGVMAPLVGIIGSMVALETIKVLTDYGNPLTGRIMMVDTMTMQFNELTILKQPNCPICHHA